MRLEGLGFGKSIQLSLSPGRRWQGRRGSCAGSGLNIFILQYTIGLVIELHKRGEGAALDRRE
jgi:hypothetical protein